MPRKKSAKTATETTTAAAPEESANETATSAATLARPAWIEGAPVTVDGQIIREGSPRPTPQMELPASAEGGQSEQSGPPETEPHGKNWGDPYKSIFSCPEMGFELGENRRFKQRVFQFNEKPTGEILSELKENGFIYRAAEKAWTIPATPASRKLTDDLARKWAGPDYIQSVER